MIPGSPHSPFHQRNHKKCSEMLAFSMILVSPHSHSRWMAPPETPRSVEMARILLPFARVLRLSELWLGGVSAPRKSILPCFFQCFCCKPQGLNIGAPFIDMLFCAVIYMVLCASQVPSENHQNEHNVAFYCVFQCFCVVFWFLYAPGPPELIF